MDPTADITLDEFVQWVDGRGRCGSVHSGGMSVGFGDGRVQTIDQTIRREALRDIGKIDTVSKPER